MFKTKLARLGAILFLLGIGILGASLYTWTQSNTFNRIYYTKDEHKWVDAFASNAPAVGIDEIWLVRATCVRPYFVKALEKARTELSAYNKTMPDQLRELKNRPATPDPTTATDYFERLNRVQRQREESLRAIEIETKYLNWTLNRRSLEEAIEDWERRLNVLGDQRILFSEAIYDMRNDIRHKLRAEAGQKTLSPELVAIWRLGLSDFADSDTAAIRQSCINVTLINKVVAKTTHHTDVGRWPYDHPLPFWFGIALLFFGLALSPVATWVVAGK